MLLTVIITIIRIQVTFENLSNSVKSDVTLHRKNDNSQQLEYE